MSSKLEIIWDNVLVLVLFHYFALTGLYYLATFQVLPKTLLWFCFLFTLSTQGVTAGVHRFWSHRSFKATLPLRLLLCFLQTLSFQNTIYVWARDHRIHHKFTDTDADPHNSTRGFFFSHVGWLMVREHPDVIAKSKTIDVSDLEADAIVMFQKKYYLPLGITISLLIPTMVPWYFWGEKFAVAWCVPTMLRYVLVLHATWMINSFAHMWGTKPYDMYVKSVENRLVSLVTLGEGWHNYHHTFPWDYKAAELDSYSGNLTTGFIDFMAWIGWAYDRKTTPSDMIQKRIIRTGNGNGTIDYDEYLNEKKRIEILETLN